MYMGSKMRKSRSLLALSTIENAALETDRTKETDRPYSLRWIAQREYGPCCQRTEHHNECKHKNK